MKETKRVYKKIEDLTAEDFAVLTLDEENEMALIAAVRRDDPFYQYPDWFLEYPKTDGIRPSNMSGMAAWTKLLKIRKEKKPVLHPVHTIDTVMMTSDIKFENVQMAYQDEGSKIIHVPVTRGYFIPEASDVAIKIASAHVADVISYYSRADPDKESYTNSLDNTTATRLVVKNINCASERYLLCPSVASQTKCRDAVFSSCMANPEVAYSCCTKFCEQQKEHAQVHKTASQAYHKILDEKKRKIPRNMVLFPFPTKLAIPNIRKLKDIVGSMYDYLLRSRAFRGEDSGLGTITFGYLMGCMPRTWVKNICLFLDLRQVMTKYGTRVIAIMGNMKEMVVRILVQNGYYVIYPAIAGVNKLTKEQINSKLYGVYSSIAPDVSYGIYHDEGTRSPEQKKNKIIYHDVDTEGIFSRNHGIITNEVFHCFRRHISPTMDDKYSYLPSALAHNGQVICVYPKTQVFTIEELAVRTFTANVYRNNFVVTKKLFCIIDPFNGECNYTESFIIPKMKRKEKNVYVDYSMYEEEIKTELYEDKIELGTVGQYINTKREVTQDTLLGTIFDEMESTANTKDFFFKMMQKWGTSQNYPGVAAANNYGMTIDSIVEGVQKLHSKPEYVMQEYHAARAEYEAYLLRLRESESIPDEVEDSVEEQDDDNEAADPKDENEEDVERKEINWDDLSEDKDDDV